MIGTKKGRIQKVNKINMNDRYKSILLKINNLNNY